MADKRSRGAAATALSVISLSALTTHTLAVPLGGPQPSTNAPAAPTKASKVCISSSLLSFITNHHLGRLACPRQRLRP